MSQSFTIIFVKSRIFLSQKKNLEINYSYQLKERKNIVFI